MNNKEFQEFVKSKTFKDLTPTQVRLMSTMGLSGEAGELTDIIKKIEFYYQTDIAKTQAFNEKRSHIVEELGDLVHYVFMFLNATGITLDEVLESNVKKLNSRYHTNVSRSEAIARADKIGLPDDVI